MTQPTFGQWLTDYLDDNDVMQTVFAEQAGISAQYLNDMKRDRRSPSKRVVNATARITGMSVDVLSVIAGLCPPELRKWDITSLEVFFAHDPKRTATQDGGS